MTRPVLEALSLLQPTHCCNFHIHLIRNALFFPFHMTREDPEALHLLAARVLILVPGPDKRQPVVQLGP